MLGFAEKREREGGRENAEWEAGVRIFVGFRNIFLIIFKDEWDKALARVNEFLLESFSHPTFVI